MSAINDGAWRPMLTEDRVREMFDAAAPVQIVAGLQPYQRRIFGAALQPDLVFRRTIRCVSPAYLAALDRIFGGSDINGWKKFSAEGFAATWEPEPAPAVRITPDGKLVEVAP